MNSSLASMALASLVSAGVVMTAVACSSSSVDDRPDGEVFTRLDARADADPSVTTIAFPEPLTAVEIKYGGGMPSFCNDAGTPSVNMTTIVLRLDTKTLERSVQRACQANVERAEVALTAAQLAAFVERARALVVLPPTTNCGFDRPSTTVQGLAGREAGTRYFTEDSDLACDGQPVLEPAATRQLYADLLGENRDAAAP